jgi:signal peptidase II
MKYWKYYLISLLIIVIDQASKLLVHFNMELGEEILVVGEWFRLHYLLNPGMAFGIQLGDEFGKLVLTLFRMVASAGIAYWIYYLWKQKSHPVLLACIALILGGAVGNLLDSIFYGVFLEGNVIPNSMSPWLHGQVIDMLYFPMFEGVFPQWLPIWGGKSYLFFSPVFNIADSAIFVGVVLILILQQKIAPPKEEQVKREEEPRVEQA